METLERRMGIQNGITNETHGNETKKTLVQSYLNV